MPRSLRIATLFVALSLTLTACAGARSDRAVLTVVDPGVLKAEFIFESAPVPSCHATTIVESGGVLLAAWFAGSDEGNKDVGIWLSRSGRGGWTPPVEVATGVQIDGTRHPCWNPVLFQPAKGPLMLFYKKGCFSGSFI
jgi:predicted neuraminidase